jgi:hypothetical protein
LAFTSAGRKTLFPCSSVSISTVMTWPPASGVCSPPAAGAALCCALGCASRRRALATAGLSLVAAARGRAEHRERGEQRRERVPSRHVLSDEVRRDRTGVIETA